MNFRIVKEENIPDISDEPFESSDDVDDNLNLHTEPEVKSKETSKQEIAKPKSNLTEKQKIELQKLKEGNKKIEQEALKLSKKKTIEEEINELSSKPALPKAPVFFDKKSSRKEILLILASNQEQIKKKTALSKGDLTKALIEGWKKLFNTEPTQQQLLIVLSQIGIETGNGTDIYNYNLGNITKTPKDSFDYFLNQDSMPKTQDGKTVWTKYIAKFRSYDNLEQGVLDYLKFISKKNYQNVWNAVLEGDPKKFVHELKQKGYYTADEKQYQKGLLRAYDAFDKSKEFQKATANLSVKPIEVSDPNVDALELVLKSLFNDFKLANNKVLIQINGEDNCAKIEFARMLSLALYQEINAKTKICEKFGNIQINCEVKGPAKLTNAAINEVCDTVKELFKFSTNYNFDCFIFPGMKSKYDELGINKVSNNFKSFQKRFVK
jgi:flagellum-specific peptidoglycan hydrolase FlgJ